MEDEPASESFDAEGIYICDSCGEEIVIPLDPHEGLDQSYIEDCPVCCHPNEIHVRYHGGNADVWSDKH